MQNHNMKKNTSELENILENAASFGDFAAEMNEEFLAAEVARDLQELIGARHVKKRDLFIDANINETYGYEILNGKRYPSRDVLLSLFLSLHLTVDEVNRFLRTHGYAPLYVRKKADAAVVYCLKHGWSVMQCNELLYENGLPLLRKEMT
jgi:hypothetical protein